MALAKSQACQDAADAPATLRAYSADLANYQAWCQKHGFVPMPATPAIVGAYLAAAGEGYALPTLRRVSRRLHEPAASLAIRSTLSIPPSVRRSAGSAASTAPRPAGPPH